MFSKYMQEKAEYERMKYFDPFGEFEGIKALFVRGIDRGNRKTGAFAYIGYPKNLKEGEKAPGIVLVHGGCGHAFLEWVKLWNDRGYVAIAADNTGYVPTMPNAGDKEICKKWTRELSGYFNKEGYTNTPDNDGMLSANENVDNMWMTHCVAQSMLMYSVLEQQECVDSTKIGITGISWGGIITSLVIGYDNRFAFAIPVYGSGYLDKSYGLLGNVRENKETLRLWMAQHRFKNVSMPVLWLAWNDDNCFSINSNSLSYKDTVINNDKTLLSIKDHMYHSHYMGWIVPESYIFADSVVKNGPEMTSFLTQPDKNSAECVILPKGGEVVSAKMYYLKEDITYSQHTKYEYDSYFMDQEWSVKEAVINGDKIQVQIPSEAVSYYIEVVTNINGIDTITCSEYVEGIKK